MDALTKANEDWKKQGACEVEISYRGEYDLHRSLIMCSKNPGHRKFIPIDKFNIDYLPSLYHNEDVVNAVRAMADITVRVSVKYVSERRPKTYPNSDKPYPCYSDRGQGMMRVGSGLLNRVEIYPQDGLYKQPECECKACGNSTTPEKKFAIIRIMTAAHVVFDKLEGEHTTCHLFFDRGVSPEDCSDTIEISGFLYVKKRFPLVTEDIENDSNEMVYYTHDLNFADKLSKFWERYRITMLKVGKRYMSGWKDSHIKLSDCTDNPDKIVS